MKKIVIWFLLLIGMLSGCAKEEPVLFIVTDEIMAENDGHLQYNIQVRLPDDTVEAVSSLTDKTRMFEAADGKYYIITQVLENCNAEEAIKNITGFDAEKIGALCTQMQAMPEYRFSWCAEGENGMLSCTGVVVEDDHNCYCLEFFVQEQYAKECAQVREQIMSSFGLYLDE